MSRRTLITLGLALTVVAFIGAEADFWSDYGLGRHDSFHTTTLLTSFRVSHRGEIELDEAETGIVAMSPNAVLEVRERRFLTRRRLSVRADASGRPEYEFAVGSRERSEADARKFLAVVMPSIVRSTTIGARPRAQHLLETKGLDGLLREVALLDSNAVRRIYIEEAITVEGLTEEQGLRVVRTAGREINSSSRLHASLAFLAEELPQEWMLGEEFAMAAESIASSSEKGAALVEIVRLRGLEVASARATADALQTIAAASEKRSAIIRIARLDSRPEIIEQLLEPIDSIQSSSERRRALEELVSFPDLAASAYARALDIGYEIASSSEKAAFLSALADVLPSDEALQRRYLRVAASIAASSEQRRAMMALLERQDLSAAVVGEVAVTAEDSIASTSERQAVIDRAREVLRSDPAVEEPPQAPTEPASEAEPQGESETVPVTGTENGLGT